jgi:hypothetical protein
VEYGELLSQRSSISRRSFHFRRKQGVIRREGNHCVFYDHGVIDGITSSSLRRSPLTERTWRIQVSRYSFSHFHIRTVTDGDTLHCWEQKRMMMIMLKEWNYVSELQPPTGLLFIPKVIYSYAHGEPWWNDIDRGKWFVHHSALTILPEVI